MNSDRPINIRRIGFVSTRIAGTDGVSLETKKWAEVLAGMGFDCYFIAGECDGPPERTAIIEEAHFQHPRIADINRRSFGAERRSEELTDDITELARTIRKKLKAAIKRFDIDVLIAENSLTIPMNIPLGLAIVHAVQELDVPCIAHHHDFYWERERYLATAVDDFIRAAFPPALRQIDHIVINSQAAEEFSHRTGLSCRVIPNVMNFASPPKQPDEYALQFRQTIGLADDDLLILQPTRVVARKGIEHAIELVRLLDNPRAKLVITHASGDEGDSYARRLRRFADLLEVQVIFANQWIADNRGVTPAGQPIFTMSDVYPQADLVTYPSSYEGFGNAFLEAVYFQCPILCNRYAIFRTDIEPSGFHTILLDGFLTDDAVTEVRRVLTDAAYRQEMVEHNYDVGRQFFSFDLVEQELQSIFRRPTVACRCCPRGETASPPIEAQSDCCCEHETSRHAAEKRGEDHGS